MRQARGYYGYRYLYLTVSTGSQKLLYTARVQREKASLLHIPNTSLVAKGSVNATRTCTHTVGEEREYLWRLVARDADLFSPFLATDTFQGHPAPYSRFFTKAEGYCRAHYTVGCETLGGLMRERHNSVCRILGVSYRCDTYRSCGCPFC